MNYTVLALLGVLLAVVMDQMLLRTRLLRSKPFWASYAIIVFFQLVTNGVLTGIPIVRYDANRIIGWRLAYAPVEDLLFGFALVTITLSLWVFAGAPARERAAAPEHGPTTGGDKLR